jgi:DNA-binding NtrC family response regulator
MLTRVILALATAEERRRLKRVLRNNPDCVVQTVRGQKPSWDRLSRVMGDLLVVSRSNIPAPVKQHIAALKEVPDAPEIIVISSEEDAHDQAQLLAAGCVAVLDASLDDELLREALVAVISRQREEAVAKLDLPQDIIHPRLSDFVSHSPAMQTFMDIVQKLVNSDTTLLLAGETGVGKERLAQAIHAEGPRSQGPFVAVNCGAIPEPLLESELFGHQEGAFTGATRARRGWFELAHAGTIFLDEIGEMPLHLQVKLLRVLQTHEVYPVGAERAITVDVRVMAATNRDLEAEARAKTFRQDLYYRLSVVTLEIPPLRERKEDIPSIVERYIQYFQSKLPTSVQSVSRDAMAALTEYEWPGNVREIVNVIERAMLLCAGEEIELDDIPVSIQAKKASTSSGPKGTPPFDIPFREDWLRRPLREVKKEIVETVEQSYLKALLAETRGRIEETAKRAGINSRNLFDKMRKFALKKEDFRKRR